MEHAWHSSDDYVFGPLSVDAMVDQGLTVTGPDLSGVRRVLARVAGLEATDE